MLFLVHVNNWNGSEVCPVEIKKEQKEDGRRFSYNFLLV
jgi:hypothetical protein